MGAGQSTWSINDCVHDPIEQILSSVYQRRPELQRRLLALAGGDGKSGTSGDGNGDGKGDEELKDERENEAVEKEPKVENDIFAQASVTGSITILDHLIPFLMGPTLVNCMECSSTWFAIIVQWIKIKCRMLDQQFEQAYGDILTMDKSTVKFEPVYVAEKALRMDWVVYAKVKPPCANKITQIGYSFAYVDGTTNRSCSACSTSTTPSTIASGKHCPDKDGAGSDRSTGSSGSDESNVSEATSVGEDAPLAQHPNATSASPTFTSRRSETATNKGGAKKTLKGSSAKVVATSIVSPLNSSYEGGRGAPREYQVNYQFNTFTKGTSRELWLHKDICRFHGDETKVAAMPSVGIVCVDDRIEVAVNLLNAFGLVQLDSIRWLPSHSLNLTSVSPLTRVCPIETTHKDWFDIDRFQMMTTERLRQPETFAPFLSHVQTSFAGVDIAVRRAQYRAVLQGCVGEKAERAWGMPCEVHPAWNPVVCSLNRLGLQHDRGLSVQLRVGDSLVYYLSQGGANPA
eukprot:GHVS01095511.1.p1 GENE.GHVS01095511.1~~GHVS01095511.1.p1  ORF type:complete len:516 (-),score=55.21 GHVS01095511.1:528-2075(-)